MITHSISVDNQEMVKSTFIRTSFLFLIFCVVFVVFITVAGTISGAPALQSDDIELDSDGEKYKSADPKFKSWDQDKKPDVNVPNLDTVENTVKNTAKKLYDKYLGNLTDFGDDAECLLGSAEIYVWWLDDAGHIRPQLGYKEEALCDISNANLSEYRINVEEMFEAKVKY